MQTHGNINVCTNTCWYKWVCKHLLIEMSIQTLANINVCTNTCWYKWVYKHLLI